MNARANENALARGASQGIEGVRQTTSASNLAHPLNPAKKLTVLRAIGSQVLAKIWVGSKNGHLPQRGGLAHRHPEKRKFANPDVVAHARTIRDAVLRDVIGIVAGGLRAAPALPSGSRFQRWDKMVRRPLAWAADVDLAAAASSPPGLADQATTYAHARAILNLIRDLI